MNRKSFNVFADGYWGRALLLSLMLFFVYLGDGILSDWLPAFMQEATGSALIMGFIVAFSSVVGFGADLIFPQLLKTIKTRKLLMMAIGTSLVFSGVLLWAVVWPWIAIFLVAMAVWGLYYEFIGFGSQQFVAGSVPANARSGVWAILGVFKSLAYFLGPILGSIVTVTYGNSQTVIISVVFVLIGYGVWLLMGRSDKERGKQEDTVERLSLQEEIKHWILLSEHVWQILLVTLLMGLIDATFWTTGTVLSDNLGRINPWGNMFLPAYMLPMIFVGVIEARWGVYKGKKKISEISLLISGIMLALLGFFDSVYILLAIAFLAGTALSIAWPLVNAVYSDIIYRMKGEGKHMMGLSSSIFSVAYIFGPILSGVLSEKLGEGMTFSVIGVITAITALFLLFVTPKKFRLPQIEIRSWDKPPAVGRQVLE